MLYKLGSR